VLTGTKLDSGDTVVQRVNLQDPTTTPTDGYISIMANGIFPNLHAFTGLSKLSIAAFIPTGNTTAGTYFLMDDFKYEITSAIPAAVWLMGSGLLGIMGLSRKKAKIAV